MTTAISDMHDGHTLRGQYDTQPTVGLASGERIVRGPQAWRQVADLAVARAGERPVILVDAYPGVDVPELTAQVRAALSRTGNRTNAPVAVIPWRTA